MYPYHVLDVETSGFDTEKHDIAELAIITCQGSKIVDIFHQYYSVNIMTPEASTCNNLTVEKLRYFSPFNTRENISKVQSILKYPIWAHNAPFDIRFLKKYFHLNGDIPIKDTLPILRNKNKSKIDKLPNNQLSTWFQYYGISVQEHTALGDAFGLYKIINLEGLFLNGNL